MATTNKGLNQPALGSTGWGTPINDNATILDRALGDYADVAGTTGSVSLNTTQVQSMCLKSGTTAFTADVTFVIPSSVKGQWVVVNQSASNIYNLIVKNAASATSVSIPNGQTRTVYSDGNIVFFVDTQSPSVLQNLAIGAGFATTNASCVATTATVTFSGGYLIAVGQTISIKGVTPAGYNGVWTVTASSAGSVTFTVPTTQTSQTVAGTIYYGAITASTIDLSGKGAVSGVSTQAEAEAGTDNTTLMTPLRTSQAIAALTPPSEGLTLLGTLTTTSGSTQTLSGLVLTSYKQLLFMYNSVRSSSATIHRVGSASISNTLSGGGGGTYVKAKVLVSLVDGYAYPQLAINGSSATGAFLQQNATDALLYGPQVEQTGYTTATTSVSVSLSAGTFNAGSVVIYGVK
jgi:hypothetical protein